MTIEVTFKPVNCLILPIKVFEEMLQSKEIKRK